MFLLLKKIPRMTAKGIPIAIACSYHSRVRVTFLSASKAKKQNWKIKAGAARTKDIFSKKFDLPAQLGQE
jgi:hypothetical protein